MKYFQRIFLYLLIGVLSGCASHIASSPEKLTPSGFLSPDVQKKMRDGDSAKWEPAKLYRNDNADWTQFDKILIDPVIVYVSTDPNLKAYISPEDEQYVINYFQSSLVEHVQLSPHFALATEPGPGTIRAMFAITQLAASSVTMDAVSTYIPQMRLVTAAGTMHREKPAFVGEIGVEAKWINSQNRELLGAAIDKRYGGKKWGKNLEQWADVKNVIDYYARMIMYRFCMQKKLPDCSTP
jgi:uncharacterized protein DUF3313